MILYPNAKINIGLNILRKRNDGYHDISSVFYPILTLFDILEIKIASEFSCVTTGAIVSEKENLCSKAFYMLRKEFNIPNVSICLHKRIPIGSGLGGGSSDAVSTLKGLNNIFNLKLDQKRMHFYASKLGADCPFFVQNTAKYVEGIGENLIPLSLDLDKYNIKFIHSNIHIASSVAYSNIKVHLSHNNLKELIKAPIDSWRKNIRNDFESFIFNKYPILLNHKNKLYENGAVYASLTGSGSTVYGIFRK